MNKLTFFALSSALFLGLSSCGDKEKTDKTVSEEKAPNIKPVDPNKLRIAYYYSDSLREGFAFYKKEDDRITKKGESLQNQMMSMERSIQTLGERYQKYMQEGTVTPDEIQRLETEINRKREQYVSLQSNQGAALEKETQETLTALSKKIEAAGKKYCQKYGIDMLLIHGPGGQINYVDEKMNVTKSFIDFLNAEQAKMEADMGGKK